MASMTPSDDLLEWCDPARLDYVQISAASVDKWKSALAGRIAALAPGTIDTLDTSGRTALGRLASYRPPEELKIMILQGMEQLLAAGANPLSGRRPAILQGLVFSEDMSVNKMLAALVAAQRAGSPYRTDQGGNLLHAMSHGNIGVFAHLAQDGFNALEGCQDVVSAWRDEPDAQGRTPVDLAWERYPTAGWSSSEGEIAAICLLLLPGKKSIWDPPSMDMRCADGNLLYQRILSKVDRGMPVPKRVDGVVEKLRAMALNEDMTKDTPQASGATSPRPPRL